MTIDLLDSIDQIFQTISAGWTASAAANFIAAFISSCLAFQIYTKLVSNHDDLAKRFAAIRKIKKEFGWDYHFFMLLYSSLTGLMVSAFIYIQFKGDSNIPYAILYGTLGPYALRDKLSEFIAKPLQDNVVSAYQKEISTIEEKTGQAEDKYLAELNAIKERLAQGDTGGGR